MLGLGRLVDELAVRALDALRAEQRNDRERDEVGGEQRDDYRECQGGEQKAADSVQHRHGEEDDDCGKGSGEHRQRDLLAATFRRDPGRFPFLKMTEDVFEHHDRVVDEA